MPLKTGLSSKPQKGKEDVVMRGMGIGNRNTMQDSLRQYPLECPKTGQKSRMPGMARKQRKVKDTEQSGSHEWTYRSDIIYLKIMDDGISQEEEQRENNHHKN